MVVVVHAESFDMLGTGCASEAHGIEAPFVLRLRAFGAALRTKIAGILSAGVLNFAGCVCRSRSIVANVS